MNEFYFQKKYNLKIGDRLVRHKGGFFTKHHGVYAGQDRYGNLLVAENQVNVGVRCTTLSSFMKNDASNLVRIERFRGNGHARQKVISRINKLLGKSYDLISFNCEHFANYVIYGRSNSPQIAKAGLGLFGVAVLSFLGAGIAASAEGNRKKKRY